MPSVLFVCTANRFRSPLAAGILGKALQEMGIAEAWRIGSAGTWATPGQPVLRSVCDVAQGFGIDLSGHRSERVSSQVLSDYDLILVMEASHREALMSEFPGLQERVYLLSDVVERRSYDILDTLASEQEAALFVTDLNSFIRRGLNYICVLATYLNNTRARYEPANG